MKTVTLYFVAQPEPDGSTPNPSLFYLNEDYDFVSQEVPQGERVYSVGAILMDDTVEEVAN